MCVCVCLDVQMGCLCVEELAKATCTVLHFSVSFAIIFAEPSAVSLKLYGQCSTLAHIFASPNALNIQGRCDNISTQSFLDIGESFQSFFLFLKIHF